MKDQTSVEGIYAASDVATVPYKQIVISMGEGAKAALAAFEYLMLNPLKETEKQAALAQLQGDITGVLRLSSCPTTYRGRRNPGRCANS